jgi:protein SCO1/2
MRVLAAIGFAALALAGVAAFQLSRLEGTSFNGTSYPDAPAAPEFSLTDHDGEPRTLADFRGRTAIVFFGFTQCPDVCPLTLAKLQRVLNDEDLEPEEVTVLFITVDPERDTPEVMKAYAEGVGRSIVGLTGSGEEIDRTMAAYGVFAEPMTGHDGKEALAHTPIAYGIDKTGRMRVLIHPEEAAEIVAEDVGKLAAIVD